MKFDFNKNIKSIKENADIARLNDLMKEWENILQTKFDEPASVDNQDTSNEVPNTDNSDAENKYTNAIKDDNISTKL